MQARQKQERIIEAVRLGLEGDAAVEFLCGSGYAMTSPAIARNLRQLGGRKALEDLIAQGMSNAEVLQLAYPEDAQHTIPHQPPTQRELFQPDPDPADDAGDDHMPLYETTKLTIRIPRDLYEAIRVAAKAENKPQNQLIIDILTAALSRLP
jgi:hypothetical protein